MKSFATLSALVALFAASASAHGTFQNLIINGVDAGYGENTYIRTPRDPGVGFINGPVKDVKSQDMICNNNNREVPKWVQVPGGAKLGVKFLHEARSEGDVIASSHVGPAVVYIAPAAQGTAGKGFVKLSQDGYTGPGMYDDGVSRLVKNKGIYNFDLPKLAPGKYLLRPELITLHEGDVAWSKNNARGTQLYMECIQIEVTGSGSLTLPSSGEYVATFPGAYSEADLTTNVYGSNMSNYKVPGPKVWNGVSGGPAAPANPAPAPVTTTTRPAPQPTTAAPKPTTTAQPATTTKAASSSKFVTSVKPPAATGGAVAQKWMQCGGKGFTGPTKCAAGLTCKNFGEYYSQCL